MCTKIILEIGTDLDLDLLSEAPSVKCIFVKLSSLACGNVFRHRGATQARNSGFSLSFSN